jgi:hypothetical protein
MCRCRPGYDAALSYMLVALLLASLLAMSADETTNSAAKPNIVLCMTDDQGWGDVSYNGLKQIQTPALDAMAAAGLRFNRFYAQQSCSPARASVMTGRHPNRMGVFWPGMPLRRQEITVAQAAKAAGRYEGPLRGHHAFDSDLHKALEGALYSLQHCPDDRLRHRVEGILDRILAAQQKDGFLISCFIVQNQDKRWDDLRLEHQMYNTGHFFEMAIAHERLTGNPWVLDAAQRFADHIDDTFGPGKRYDVDGHQEVELALVKLYRATGERRYLELSRFFLDERGYAHGMERKPFVPPAAVELLQPDPSLSKEEQRRANFRAQLRIRNGRMQDHKPVVEQIEAVGHAVRAGYMYAAMADIVRFMDAPGSTSGPWTRCGAMS